MAKFENIIIVIILLFGAYICAGIFNSAHYQRAELKTLYIEGFNGPKSHAIFELEDGTTLVVLHGAKGHANGSRIRAKVEELSGKSSALYLSCFSGTHGNTGAIRPLLEAKGVAWVLPVPGGLLYGEMPEAVQVTHSLYRNALPTLGHIKAKGRYYLIELLKPFIGYSRANKIVPAI